MPASAKATRSAIAVSPIYGAMAAGELPAAAE